MLKGCLVCSSMRLGVPFIAPRQLGAVESIPGRQFLPSVAWRTGQSGAPPDTVRCGFLSFFGEADRWRFRAVGAPDTVRCTPDSPVNFSRTPPTISQGQPFHQSHPGAPATGRCTTGQSGAPRLRRVLAAQPRLFQIGLFLFLAIRHNTLVFKTMY
jgi:hypothetical protein